jgi:hypothetical protein
MSFSKICGATGLVKDRLRGYYALFGWRPTAVCTKRATEAGNRDYQYSYLPDNFKVAMDIFIGCRQKINSPGLKSLQ